MFVFRNVQYQSKFWTYFSIEVNGKVWPNFWLVLYVYIQYMHALFLWTPCACVCNVNSAWERRTPPAIMKVTIGIYRTWVQWSIAFAEKLCQIWAEKQCELISIGVILSQENTGLCASSRLWLLVPLMSIMLFLPSVSLSGVLLNIWQLLSISELSGRGRRGMTVVETVTQNFSLEVPLMTQTHTYMKTKQDHCV